MKWLQSIFARKSETKVAKLELNSLSGVVLTLAVAGLILAFTTQIVTNIGNGFTAGTTERNVTTQVNAGFSRIADYWDEIGLVIAAVIMIGLLVRGFSNAAR